MILFASPGSRKLSGGVNEKNQSAHSHRYPKRWYLFCIFLIMCPLLNVLSQDYFQQKVSYKINVTLNDQKHELTGFESLVYINNSPDSLDFLFFHLWPNAYSDNHTDLAKEIFSNEGRKKLFNDPDLRGYIDSIKFEVDGKSVKWFLIAGSPDICKIILTRSLQPGDSICITTPFRVIIPQALTSRYGHIGESYQISQWYPKPAVYDQSGWHQIPYLDQGEFYSEFGSFDVSITLPANYIVAATGHLQNEEEKQFLESKAADISWITEPDFGGGEFPPSAVNLKTLRYTENNVHDFAWFADKRFHVLKGKVKLPESGREVTTWAMFTNQEALLWLDAINYVNSAIKQFSDWCGDYPYDSFIAVQSALSSGAGMEYPGLTVIGLAKDPYLLDEVISHEICHSWFYSALGSDERRYPYLDESLASAYESRYMNFKYPGKKLWEVSLKNEKLAKLFHIEQMPVQRGWETEWLIPALENTEQPVNLASHDYNYENYGSIIYFKGGQGFNYLRVYLGDSLFDSIMHNYYHTWKFRHPGPEDLRAIFESNTEKDLTWFFEDFLGTNMRLDYKIKRFESDSVLIKNKGELKAPLNITGLNGDTVKSNHWEDGFAGKKWIKPGLGNVREIRIDPGHDMTEIYRLNNNTRTAGLFRKADPIKLRLLFTFEDTDNRTLLYTPVFDWNRTDGFMAGVALLNSTLIPKPVEYFIIPLYTFSKNKLAGFGKISFNITPYNSLIRKAKLTLEGEQFGAVEQDVYKKVKIGMDLFFRPQNMINPISSRVFGYYTAASDLNEILNRGKAEMMRFTQLGYEIKRNGVINPYNLLFSLESGRSFQKSSADINYRLSYYGKNNGLDMRMFVGKMLRNDPSNPYYAFSVSGRGGRELYMYNGLFPDRFGEFPNTLWSRQMNLSEGGLVTPLSDTLGYSRWICALSISSSLPGKASRIPVKPFLNVSLSDAGTESGDKTQIYYEAGVKAGIWNLFEIYIPILISDNINSITGNLKERIRFVFNLDILNPQRN